MSHFYTPWKSQKTFGFLTFSGGIEMWQWTKMGYWPWLHWRFVKPLSANPTIWSNTLKQFVVKNRQIVWVCLTILVGLVLKELKLMSQCIYSKPYIPMLLMEQNISLEKVLKRAKTVKLYSQYSRNAITINTWTY